MADETRRGSLSTPRQRVLEMMQEIDFGWIVFRKCNGEPELHAYLRVVKKIKLGAENGPRPELALRDFALKDPVKRFFAEFDRLEDGVIVTVLVKHGLPFMLEVDEVMQE